MFSNIAELLFLQKSLGKQYIFKSTNGKKIVTNFGINGKKNHLLIWSVDCKKVILENNICTLNLNLCLNCKIRKFNKCEMNQPKQLLGFFLSFIQSWSDVLWKQFYCSKKCFHFQSKFVMTWHFNNNFFKARLTKTNILQILFELRNPLLLLMEQIC